MPVAEHAPTPHVVGVDAIPSSVALSQSLSIPSHISAVGAPGVQLSTITPPTQLNVPAAEHAPTPHDVDVGT